MLKQKFSPKLPLSLDENGQFINISQRLENIKQKLRTIVLTNPGEKIMDPSFGVGVRKFVFEPSIGIIRENPNGSFQERIEIEDFNEALENSIVQQVRRYSDDIAIENITTEINEEKLYISITYNYKNLTTDTLLLEV